MEFEAIGRISVGDLSFQICWQVDDIDGSEWAFLRADSASDAQPLRNKSDFRIWRNLDAKFPSPNNRARLLAFLTAFLRLAFVTIDNGNAIFRCGLADCNQMVKNEILPSKLVRHNGLTNGTSLKCVLGDKKIRL